MTFGRKNWMAIAIVALAATFLLTSPAFPQEKLLFGGNRSGTIKATVALDKFFGQSGDSKSSNIHLKLEWWPDKKNQNCVESNFYIRTTFAYVNGAVVGEFCKLDKVLVYREMSVTDMSTNSLLGPLDKMHAKPFVRMNFFVDLYHYGVRKHYLARGIDRLQFTVKDLRMVAAADQNDDAIFLPLLAFVAAHYPRNPSPLYLKTGSNLYGVYLSPHRYFLEPGLTEVRAFPKNAAISHEIRPETDRIEIAIGTNLKRE